MSIKSLKKITSAKIKVFKVKNRSSYAAICMDNLTEGKTAQQAVKRLKHPLRRMGFELAMAATLIMSFASQSMAASASEIDLSVKNTLERFYSEVRSGKNLVKDAKGVLVFPAVFKGGIGLGGEYGEGALLIKGKTADYYSTAAASIGFQLGVQKKSILILFMDKNALDKFQSSDGWEAGLDASIAVVTVGADGDIDTTKTNQPIIGFVIGQAGLMYNLTLEGSKYTRISK